MSWDNEDINRVYEKQKNVDSMELSKMLVEIPEIKSIMDDIVLLSFKINRLKEKMSPFIVETIMVGMISSQFTILCGNYEESIKIIDEVKNNLKRFDLEVNTS